MYILKEQSADI
uniref:Uncharacterized protein n=1 Tax=Rhizophora mucronata TaxID=61149 RepID=A0A2P2NQQ5_RHIMU